MKTVPSQTEGPASPEGPPAKKDMSRWLGDGGKPILAAIGVSFDDYGIEDDDRAGWAAASWEPTSVACSRTVRPSSCGRSSRKMSRCGTNLGGLLEGVDSSRFSSLIKQFTHEMAARYCFIDYDREIAIVAEIEEDGHRKLAGVGRLVADANHEVAEFAILSAISGKTGASAARDGLLRRSRQTLGVKRIVAEVAKNNARMLATFNNRIFALNGEKEEDVVLVNKEV